MPNPRSQSLAQAAATVIRLAREHIATPEHRAWCEQTAWADSAAIDLGGLPRPFRLSGVPGLMRALSMPHADDRHYAKHLHRALVMRLMAQCHREGSAAVTFADRA